MKKMKSILLHILRKVKRLPEEYLKRKIRKRFDGKPLSAANQAEIQKAIKKNPSNYAMSEKAAKKMACNWRSIINQPQSLQNLRFIENAVPVALQTSEKYSPNLAVMLQSLLDNTNSYRKYHFIVFEQSLLDNTKTYLINQVSKYSHCIIDFINPEHSLDEISNIIQSVRYPVEVFFKFFIPYWLKYPKVIYCDTDMLAKADIAEIYDIDILNHSIGACVSYYVHHIKNEYRYSHFIKMPVFMLLENWYSHFNSGLLVFNTKKFKEKISCKNLFNFSIYYINRYKHHMTEQDILNILFNDDCFHLPPEWNCLGKFYSDDNEYRFKVPARNVKIIHFTGSLRPWVHNLQKTNPFVLEYRDFAKNVPLYNDRILKHIGISK